MPPAPPMRSLTRRVLACLLTLAATSAQAQEPETPATEPAVPAPAAAEPPAATTTDDTSPFTPEQEAWIEKKIAASHTYTLGFDIFMKGLYQNDQSQGSTWLGNPHPEGDNYSGTNGIAAVLGIRIDGHVTESLTAGARLETRFGQQFADFYENGDSSVGDNGQPGTIDATGESLGMNHAAYAQLRGIYINWDRPTPIPTVTTLRAGSSDLGLWSPWTVGRIRFIDRDNAKGFFIIGEVPKWHLDYNAARVALPKLYASAGFNTGIADPLIENPFWARDAAYAAKVHVGQKAYDVTLIGSYLLDEEADLNDPDALGSTNLIDEKDGVVTTIPRYVNVNSTIEAAYHPNDRVHGEILVGYSHSAPDMDLVFDSIDYNQGLSPIPLRTVDGYAIRARYEGKNLVPGLSLRAEYFNIGADWVATLGQRREEDVLYTEGFLDGQLPTLNIANEFMDFTEPFYESIVGWHGGTLKPRFTSGPIEVEVEGTLIGYNTNQQGRCTSMNLPGCTRGEYPDFLYPDGMTDTDFYTFANTNDRGRDPRAVYKANQNRITYLGFARVGYRMGSEQKPRGSIDGSVKFIYDKDLRATASADPTADDSLGKLLTLQVKGTRKLTDRFSVGGGLKIDLWDEAHRSGAVVAGVAHYPDYSTFKSKVWVEARYELAGANFSYRLEWLNKDVDVSYGGVDDPSLSFSYTNVFRSIAGLYAGF
jgi:hypothetical protein